MAEAVPHKATTAKPTSANFVLRGKRMSYTLPLVDHITKQTVRYVFYPDRITRVTSQAHIEVLRSKADTFAETDTNGVELSPQVGRRGMGPITMKVVNPKKAVGEPVAKVTPTSERIVDPALDLPATEPAVEKSELEKYRHLSRDQRTARDNANNKVQAEAPKNPAQIAREVQTEAAKNDERAKAFACPHCGQAFHNSNVLTKHVMLQCSERGSVAQTE